MSRALHAVILASALGFACRDHEVVTIDSAAPSASGSASTVKSAAPISSVLHVIEHRPSDALTLLQPFIDAKCTPPPNQKAIGVAEQVLLDCSHATFAASSGCNWITVDGSLRGLEPYHPIALCYANDARASNYGDPSKPEEKGDLGEVGCMTKRRIAYLVENKEGAFHVVRTWRELESLYAPITSPDEALSWVLLRGGDQFPLARIQVPARAQLAIDSIDASFAARVGDAYRVRLFRSEGCGCNPMQLTAVDYLVELGGTTREEKTQRVYTTDQVICHD